MFLIVGITLFIFSILIGSYLSFCMLQPSFNRPLLMMNPRNVNKVFGLYSISTLIAVLIFTFIVSWKVGLISFITQLILPWILSFLFSKINIRSASICTIDSKLDAETNIASIDVQLLLSNANLYNDMKDYDKALEYYSKVLQLGPFDSGPPCFL